MLNGMNKKKIFFYALLCFRFLEGGCSTKVCLSGLGGLTRVDAFYSHVSRYPWRDVPSGNAGIARKESLTE